MVEQRKRAAPGRGALLMALWVVGAAGAAQAQAPEAADAAEEAPLQWVEVEPSFGSAPKDDAGVEPVDEEDPGEDIRATLDVNVRVAVHGELGEGEGEPDGEPPASSGHHFLAEASGGLVLAPGLGGVSHLLVGAGGRRPGGLLRFYGIAGLSQASVRLGGQSGGLPYESVHHQLDLVAGLRIYVPLFGPLRLFTDLLGGGTHGWSEILGGTFGAYEAQGWRKLFVGALGLQVRVTQSLSVGGRFGFRWAEDPLADLREHLGLDSMSGRSVSLGATVTWHF